MAHWLADGNSNPRHSKNRAPIAFQENVYIHFELRSKLNWKSLL